MTSSSAPGVGTAVIAGVVTTVVGFTSSFAVVLTGLAAVGADAAQASSGLLVLCVTMGLGSLLFSMRYRMPITMAWSTPGAALLAGSAAPHGGFGTAVAAFAVAGGLVLACGLIRPLAAAVASIPPVLANAMLAGVLLSLCVEPFRALAADPVAIGGVVLVWLVLLRLAPRWAVPGALAAAVVVIVVSGDLDRLVGADLAPQLVWTSPSWRTADVLALAIPLFLVTMTSQNIPGVAVLSSFGYRAPLSPALVYTGAATVAGAGFGAHAINLAAISAALAAGPQAHPDPARRWVAGATAGVLYLGIGPLSALIAAVAVAAPAGLLPTIAGLALIGAFANAAGAALAEPTTRDSAAVTFIVAASGISVAGIGAAFWGLVAGAVHLVVVHGGRRSRSTAATVAERDV